MRKSAFDFSYEWYCFAEYEIYKGIIRPTTSAQEKDTRKYNPFDFFTDTMEFTQNDRKPVTIKDQAIHASFASIKTEKDALEWVHKFGVPYSFFVDTRNSQNIKINFPNAVTDPNFSQHDGIRVIDILNEAEKFREAIDLYNHIRNNSIKDVRNIILSGDFFDKYSTLASTDGYKPTEAAFQNFINRDKEKYDEFAANYKPYTEAELNNMMQEEPEDFLWLDMRDNPIWYGQKYLSNLINYATQDVRETLIFEEYHPENHPKIGWKFPSLLALLYKMLFLDWTKGYSMRCCANQYCKKHFVPFNQRLEYCSAACVNRAKAQRHRKKLKEQKTSSVISS